MHFLKQSTSVTLRIGPFLDDTDGKTAETGLSISQAEVRLSKANGAFAQKENASGSTHEENGWYQIPLSTTDTNTLGSLQVAIAKSGALPLWETFTVLSAMVYDSMIGGGDSLEIDVKQWNGTNVASPNTSGVPLVDMVRINGGLTTGNNATLSLKALSIVNSAGSGVTIQSSGSNGHGIDILGNGTGAGINVVAGGYGHGISTAGGSSGGDGFYASANAAGNGITARGTGATGHGLNAISIAAGHGIKATGGTTGTGIYAVGGSTSGGGVVATGNGGGIGISSTGTGSNSGIVATANGSADVAGISATGTGSGAGILASGGANGSGIYAISGTSGGHGIRGRAVSAGHGLYISGGNISGSGISAYASAGDGATFESGANNSGLRLTGGNTQGSGLVIECGGSGNALDIQNVGTGEGTGKGMYIYSGSNTGVSIVSGSGDGVAIVGGENGNGLVATGGATGGSGLMAISHGEGAPGASFESDTTSGIGIGLRVAGLTSGLSATGSIGPGIIATGQNGISCISTASPGYGLYVEGSGATGIGAYVTGTTAGIYIDPTGTNGSGIISLANGTGDALHLQARGTGAGLSAHGFQGIHADGADTGTNAAGIYVEGKDGFALIGTTGKDISAKEIGTPVDLGDGASLAGNATSIAGKTSNAGTFSRSTDSLEAIRDRGDAAWLTGGAALTAQEVRDAMKLSPSAGAPATGSIDEQLDAAILELTSGTYGLEAIKAAILSVGDDVAAVDADVVTVSGKIDTIDTGVDAIVAKLPATGPISNLSTLTTIDGKTLDHILQLVMAMVNGRFKTDTPALGQTTLYKRDNVTVLTVLNTTTSERTRVS